MTVQQTIEAAPNYDAIKGKQKMVWESGDYCRLGQTLQIVGETLSEAMDIRAGQKTLDIAAGNGNFSIAAARRWADVTSTDYAEPLLENGKNRAAADRLDIHFEVADAENLPFDDNGFDAVGSTFGVMFARTSNKPRAKCCASVVPVVKSLRQTRHRKGPLGDVFKLIGKYVPPPTGVKPAALWGTEPFLQEHFW